MWPHEDSVVPSPSRSPRRLFHHFSSLWKSPNPLSPSHQIHPLLILRERDLTSSPTDREDGQSSASSHPALLSAPACLHCLLFHNCEPSLAASKLCPSSGTEDPSPYTSPASVSFCAREVTFPFSTGSSPEYSIRTPCCSPF